MGITVDTYSVWFRVDTVHGGELEFVLEAAAKRRGEFTAYRVEGFYETELYNMLVETLSETTGRLRKMQIYGDLSFEVEADTIEDLAGFLEMCAMTVEVWVKKYNINRMKPLTV